jgi:8-oxo-dGTP pyrophosphatase MutT (NUDIX family)
VQADATATPGDPTFVRALVAAHVPVGPREAAAQARMLRELTRLSRPCDEHADPVHVTASAVVVGVRGTVLHRHRRLGRWLQPGGHIGDGETPWAAAQREVCEEAGLEVWHPPAGPCLLHVDVHPGPKGHTHLDLRYLVHGPDQDPAPLPGESQDVRWCSWDEAARLGDEGLGEALAAARQRCEEVVGP